MDRKVYELWLSLACTPDTATFARLIDVYKSAEEIYAASEDDIRRTVGAKSSDCSRLNNKDLTEAKRLYNFCLAKDIGLVSYFDPHYPSYLLDIPTPPVLLYYRGNYPPINESFCCAIVGTRSLSEYGRKNAFELGYDLGKAQAVVVSGMAIGIDGVALAGAIAAGAHTVAVLGSGIDICYPEVHLRLAQEIVKNGCVMTEYPPGTKPLKYNFPQRNRIISGICRATVVVEGRENSGALITARRAREQGRVVYAVPGLVGSPGTQVTHALIKTGATLCTSVYDIIYDTVWEFNQGLNPYTVMQKRKVNMKKVLSELKVSAVSPSDDIFDRPPVPALDEFLLPPPPPPPPPVDPEKIPNLEVTPPPKIEPYPALPPFDKHTIKVYQMIPYGGDCLIEELVDEGRDIQTVVKALFKLEMAQLVVMLPGDRVKRNLK